MKKFASIMIALTLLASYSNVNANTITDITENQNVNDTAIVTSNEVTYLTRDAIYSMNSSEVNRAESEHFQIIWGNNDETGLINEAFIQGNLENLENIRSFYVNELGMVDGSEAVNNPYITGKYKTNVYISNTGLSQFENDWAYMSVDSDGFGYIFLHPDAMRVDPPSWVVPHEYAHIVTYHEKCIIPAEWYETVANWYRDQYLGSSYYKYGNTVYGPESDFFAPVVLNSDKYFPHLANYYDAWPMLLYITENPDHMNGLGKTLMKQLISNQQADETVFHSIERLSGTSIKNILGGYARRMVTMDFERQDCYLNYLNELLADATNYDKIYTTLEEKEDGWLAVSSDRAPQQGGYNIVPLNVDLDKEMLSVDFKGDAVEGADWRVSIVTKTQSGETRYSTMWNTGKNSIALQGDEVAAYLVICATPDEMAYLTCWDIDAVGTKYPYQVKITTSDLQEDVPIEDVPTEDEDDEIEDVPTEDEDDEVEDTPSNDTESGTVNVQVSGTNDTVANALAKSFKVTALDECDLAELSIRYYYTKDGSEAQNIWIDNASIQYTCAPWYIGLNSDVSITEHQMVNPINTADTYLEITFDESVALNEAATLQVSMRMAKTNWSSYDQSNDYSFTNENGVCVYYKGNLISGVEPK